MSEWQPINTAPREKYEWFMGRNEDVQRPTQYGKTSHIPLYGWCFIRSWNDGDPDYDLWDPKEWRPMLSEETIRMDSDLAR